MKTATKRNVRAALIVGMAALLVSDEAQSRGIRGGGGGGFRGGGGGGFGGGGYGGGGFQRGGYGGGGYGGGNMGGYRPQNFSSMNRGSFNPSTFRPSTGGYQNRGNFNTANRANVGNFNSGGNRVNNNMANVGNRQVNNIGNRTNNNAAVGNRGNFSGNNTAVGNRTNIGGNNNIGNRTNIGGGNTNVQVNNNRTNVGVNRSNNVGVGQHPGWSGGWRYPAAGGGWRPSSPASNYHQGWVHGYWNGRATQAARDWGGRWGYGYGWGSFATGAALGGLLGWGYGSAIYDWGYYPYTNPYYVPVPVGVPVDQPQVAQAAPVYNYSQPLSVDTPPPSDTDEQPSLDQFTAAREAFAQGNYDQALSLTDQTLKTLPNDPEIHQFRALVLFAQARYSDAAAALYAVLSVGPGWDWSTLSSLYPDVNVYTTQLRALEQYRRDHPKESAAAFVLGYHYLCDGSSEAASKQFQAAAELEPKDRLAASLAQRLAPAPASADTGGTATTAAAPANPPPVSNPPVGPKPEALIGSWTAKPAADTSIGLTIGKDQSFTWKVAKPGHDQTIAGTYGLTGDVLTLSSKDGAALVGRLASTPNGFSFKLMGGPADDPGLTFTH